MTEDEKKARIAELNDELRTHRSQRNGKIIVTGALIEDIHDGARMARILDAIRDFSDFNEDNDPHGEHDYGRVTVDGEEFMFKFDYYALNEEHLSEHPEDPNATIRVMSVLYASDY
ncbi:hypothetical protein B9J07_27865 [Sinorhizobium sp. LM21]|uniref:DUF3768 domain-containing protein n=1 Tax=Sinorhizobium sp. LM21 TaxID=1449788 RepID=UPI0005D8A7F7|nr:DUF3768 domain-containing protein [Sinorhizobium sp. LM21]AJW30190.1 hypothetical protein pLM21S1_p70 [Sinorhizobium sp. LM21]OWZ90406.1 hypothetical protein B9J07_27865 [Sinorhizobium sp. LM21]